MNKSRRDELKPYIDSGWRAKATKSHITMRKGHHILTVSSTPSKSGWRYEVAKLKRCDEGRCKHGGLAGKMMITPEKVKALKGSSKPYISSNRMLSADKMLVRIFVARNNYYILKLDVSDGDIWTGVLVDDETTEVMADLNTGELVVGKISLQNLPLDDLRNALRDKPRDEVEWIYSDEAASILGIQNKSVSFYVSKGLITLYSPAKRGTRSKLTRASVEAYRDVRNAKRMAKAMKPKVIEAKPTVDLPLKVEETPTYKEIAEAIDMEEIPPAEYSSTYTKVMEGMMMAKPSQPEPEVIEKIIHSDAAVIDLTDFWIRVYGIANFAKGLNGSRDSGDIQDLVKELFDLQGDMRDAIKKYKTEDFDS